MKWVRLYHGDSSPLLRPRKTCAACTHSGINSLKLRYTWTAEKRQTAQVPVGTLSAKHWQLASGQLLKTWTVPGATVLKHLAIVSRNGNMKKSRLFKWPFNMQHIWHVKILPCGLWDKYAGRESKAAVPWRLLFPARLQQGQQSATSNAGSWSTMENHLGKIL